MLNEIEDILLQKEIEKFYSLLELLIEIDEKIICAYKEKMSIDNQEKKSGLNLKKSVFKSIYQQHNSPPEIVIQFAQDSAKQITELEYLYNTIREKINQITIN